MSGRVTIKKVYLENFLSHKRTEVCFDRGVTVLVGPNGAGKSSILDAIYFALTDDTRRGRRKENIVNAMARGSEAVVKLWLDVGGQEVYIERRYGRGGSDAEMRVGDRWFRRVRETSNAVAEVLGLAPTTLKTFRDVLQTVAIVPQGGLTKLLTLPPADRKDMVDRLLGLDTYEKAREKLEGYTVKVSTKTVPPQTYTPRDKDVKNVKEVYSRAIKELEEVKQELALLDGREEGLRKELESLKSARERIRGELERVEGRVKGLKELEGRVKELERRVEELEEEVRAREEEVGRVRRRLKELEEVRAEVSRLEGLASLAEHAVKLSEAVKALKGREELLRAEEAKLLELRRAFKELERINAKYPEGVVKVAERLRSLQGRVRELRGEVERLQPLLADALSRKRALEGLLRDAEAKLLEAVSTASEALGRPFRSVGEAREAVAEEVRRARAEVEGLRARARGLRDEEAAARARALDAGRKLEILRGSREGKCPLCGQALTPRHRAEVEGRLREEVREWGARAEVAASKAREAEEALGRAEDRVKYLERVLTLVESSTPLEGRVRELREGVKEAEKAALEIEGRVNELVSELREIEGEVGRLAEVEADRARFEELVRRRVSREALKEAEERVERVRKEVADLESEVKELKELIARELGREPESLNEVIEASRKASVRLKELNKELGRARELEELLRKLEDEVRVRREELGRARNSYLKVRGEVEELPSLEARGRELRGRLEELSRRIGEVNNELEGIKVRREELKERARSLKSDAEELRRAWYKLAVLKWIRDNVLHRKGAPKLFRKLLLTRVEGLMKRYIEFFNLPYSDVRVDEDFNVYLASPFMEADVSRMSGGEVVVASITALLALHQIVSKGRLGFLVLDEPTIHLDEERRRQLIEVLKGFRGGGLIPQLIIVTHHDEVREAADTVYEVSRDTYSRVREVGSSYVA